MRPEVVGCFLSDLGMNILPKYDGQMCTKLIDTSVFLKLQIFSLFDILESSGMAWDLILTAFRMPGAGFPWSSRGLGIYCNTVGIF